MSQPSTCRQSLPVVSVRLAAAAVLLLLLSTTDAYGHPHRRAAGSDLRDGLSHEASRVAEGNKTSLPLEESVTHPPNKLGLALEEPDGAAEQSSSTSRTYGADDEGATPRPHHHHRHHDADGGSSRAADATISDKPAPTTSSPGPETQVSPPTGAPPSTRTMSPMEKLFSTVAPPKEEADETENRRGRGRKKKGPSRAGKSAKQEKAIKELSLIGKKLKDEAPSVIFINGRKFNQVEEVGCVDGNFYRLLQRDLAQIIPHKLIDNYETYYDYNYAKAVAAVLDASKLRDAHMAYREDRGEVLLNGLEELEKYWNTTMSVYRELKSKHQNRVRFGVAIHGWLYERLEGLKGMLMKGEESLVALNNQVRKLNKAPREQDLQQALCSCITSRSGKTVIGIMNELFVDKDSEKRLKDLEYARKQGLAMAEDAASYCAYWYGDTIRTQAKMKEKHIQGMVTTISHNKSIMRELQRHYKINRTVVTTTSIVSNVDGNEVTEVKTRIVTRLIDMTDLWLPKLADWIRSKLNIQVSSKNSREVHGSTTPDSAPLFPISLASGAANKTKRVKSGRKSRGKSNRGRVRRSPAAENSSSPEALEAALRLKHPDHPDWPALSAINDTLPTSRNTTRPKRRWNIRESQFETEISNYGEHCARKGFSVLLSVAYDQSTLMYNSDKISLDHEYIRALEESFSSSFKRLWRKKRNQWSRKMSETNATEVPATPATSNNAATNTSRTVDEEMSDSFEAVGSSYERGMRLGYMVGRFVGEKAARQWPDPAELNTFTYDSLFLAGLASGYNESATRQLEQRIVTETTKRLAYTEASRQVFAKTLASSYQNGASLVPIWGVLHGQRAVAKQAAKEGAKVGYDASVRAASEFGPRAHKFFLTHRMQRALSSPYKAAAAAAAGALNASNTEASSPNGPFAAGPPVMEQPAPPSAMGVSQEIDQVQLELEVHRRVSREATKCGKQTGLVMGALMGLVVTPEAFESFSRFRGSLEALENEFNHFKLGALRGYQFGENAAYLNYTAMLNQNLASMKNETGSAVALAKDAANKRLAKAREVSGNSPAIPFPDDQDGAGLANTDNVLQFMIVNYGPNLVANHSSKSMLKIRSQVPDDSVIQQIRLEAQDYLAGGTRVAAGDQPLSASRAKNGRRKSMKKKKKPKNGGKTKKTKKKATAEPSAEPSAKPKLIIQPPAITLMNTTTDRPLNTGNMSDAEVDELDVLFGRQRLVGELSGFLVANGTSRRHRIKINILDLGPILELEENELESNASTIRVPDSVDLKPLTDSPANPRKVFIKLQVAPDPEHQHRKEHQDPLADFLNAAQSDDGDGYMCGTFSNAPPGGKSTNRTSQLRAGADIQVDDQSLEMSLLDELARRIEEPARNYPRTSSIELVENVLGPTRDLSQHQPKSF